MGDSVSAYYSSLAKREFKLNEEKGIRIRRGINNKTAHQIYIASRLADSLRNELSEVPMTERQRNKINRHLESLESFFEESLEDVEEDEDSREVHTGF